MSAERPWEDFADPVARPAAPSSSGGGLDWEDIGKGTVGGLGRGVTGLAGTGGTVGDLTRAGLRKLGVSEPALNDLSATMRVALPFGLGNVFTGSSGSDIQHDVEKYTGKFYEPHTTAGQYASTIAEFAPSAVIPGGGGITARVLNTLVPAVASETAGQATKGTAAEPWARGITGVAGGLVGGRLVTPAPPPTAVRQAAVNVLDREGVPLTAGERTGSKAVRWAESVAGDMPLSSGAAQAQQQAQAAALDRALTRRVFDPAELERRGLPPESALPQPDVMAHGRQSLSDEYTRLSQANVLRSDPQLMKDLAAAQVKYEGATLPSQRASGARDIETIRNELTDALIAGRGTVPGKFYQDQRSRMGNLSQGAKSDPALAGALRDIRGALDRGMQRGLSPADAEAWALNNQRWGNMKQLEPAVAAAGENLSPAKVAQAVRSGRVSQAARGAGDLDELAKAASTVIKPLPQSGTSVRTGYQQLFGLPGMLSAGGGAMGSMFGPVGALAGFAAPHLVSRAVLSGPGQRYLANQAVPQTTRNLMAQTIAQQAAAQPSTAERSDAEREAYARKREQNLREIGLGP
jgi:hypothetical protein